MLERGGHYTRHYCTPCAATPRATLKDALACIRHALHCGKPEGRRRIIPGMPCDNHALGWSEPAYPPNWKGGKIGD